MRLNLHVGPYPPLTGGFLTPLQRYLTKPLDFQVDYVRTWTAPSS